MKPFKRLWPALFAGLGASTIALTAWKAKSVVPTFSSATVPDKPLTLGQRLRADLDAAIRTRPLSGRLQGTDVTDVVRPYLPVGMTFIAAEAMLRDAGFTILPYRDRHQATDVNRCKDWYAVLAVIPFIRKQFLFRTNLSVELLPEAPFDYTTVTRMTATVLVTGP